MDIKEGLTSRGFKKYTFEDCYGVKCSLQKSSLAFDSAIWFGCEDANPKVLITGKGWQPIEMPEGYVADTRMHLTREQVKDLLHLLHWFVETGEL